MSPSWKWSDKITNERVARVAYNHFISNKGKWNNCFSKFSNRVLPPIFISTILQSVRKENLAHYFPYDVKLGLLAFIPFTGFVISRTGLALTAVMRLRGRVSKTGLTFSCARCDFIHSSVSELNKSENLHPFKRKKTIFYLLQYFCFCLLQY